jgi:hypothetical protein
MVDAETVATWVSEGVPATLIDGQTVNVPIALHRPGRASVAVDFPNAGAPMCEGTPGQWAGCRGTGCTVCAETLTGFSRYFTNHPGCAKNDTCAGQFFTCNGACPAPTNADKDPAVTLSFEAEAGALTSPMVVLADATAWAGKVIWSAPGATGLVGRRSPVGAASQLLGKSKVRRVLGI